MCNQSNWKHQNLNNVHNKLRLSIKLNRTFLTHTLAELLLLVRRNLWKWIEINRSQSESKESFEQIPSDSYLLASKSEMIIKQSLERKEDSIWVCATYNRSPYYLANNFANKKIPAGKEKTRPLRQNPSCILVHKRVVCFFPLDVQQEH